MKYGWNELALNLVGDLHNLHSDLHINSQALVGLFSHLGKWHVKLNNFKEIHTIFESKNQSIVYSSYIYVLPFFV
jgi:hypothetical protein